MTDFIYATGRGLKEGNSFTSNTFKLFVDNPDLEKSICLHLDIEISGPGKSNILAKPYGNGTIGVTYNVAKPGIYLLTMKYQGKHVEGSPYRLKIN